MAGIPLSDYERRARRYGQPEADPVPMTDEELVAFVCEMTAKNGGIGKAAKKLGCSPSALWNRLNKIPEFFAADAQARAYRARHHENKIYSAVVHMSEIRKQTLDEDIQIKAAALETKTRQWLAKVNDRNTYGDKQAIEGGATPIQINTQTDSELARRLAFLLTQAVKSTGDPHG